MSILLSLELIFPTTTKWFFKNVSYIKPSNGVSLETKPHSFSLPTWVCIMRDLYRYSNFASYPSPMHAFCLSAAGFRDVPLTGRDASHLGHFPTQPSYDLLFTTFRPLLKYHFPRKTFSDLTATTSKLLHSLSLPWFFFCICQSTLQYLDSCYISIYFFLICFPIAVSWSKYFLSYSSLVSRRI